MRGFDQMSGSLFSYVDLDKRVPQNHPLRAMRELVNASLAALDASFEALYAKEGRPLLVPASSGDPAGKAVARVAIANALHGSLGTPACGTAGV